jgi:signal peptidase I
MNVDFALILFLALVGTGLVWGLDRALWASARQRRAQALLEAGRPEEARRAAREPVLVEYARAFFPVILIVFLIRSFVVEPFRIPSGSMMPSLYNGDFILVNKFSYGIRLPIVNLKVLDLGAPRRGDVIVFRFPGDPSTNYIKRVIGLPGDRIVYRDKRVYVNGTPLEILDPRPYPGRAVNGDAPGEALRATEVVDGVRHDILLTDRPEPVGVLAFEVPPGHYFVMGDNRDHSNDSRYWGYVPEENLVGKAFLVWFSLDTTTPDKWLWQRIIWHRIGNSIQ